MKNDNKQKSNIDYEAKYERLRKINEFLFSSLLLLPLFFTIAWFVDLADPFYTDGISDLFAILITPIMFAVWFLSGEYVYVDYKNISNKNSNL